jgi:hypothetical protein
MDAAGQFLVDFQDLPDLAVLAVGGLGRGLRQLLRRKSPPAAAAALVGRERFLA